MSTMVTEGERRGSLISRGWVQAAALISICGFFVLVLMGYQAYTAGPPIPERVVTQTGQQVATGADIRAGQDVFLRYGLMQYGSIFGHGAYLGPDFTADYLHRAAESVRDTYGGTGSDTAAQRTRDDFKVNRYNEATGTLTISDAQAAAHSKLIDHYATSLGNPEGRTGLRPKAITNPEQIRQLTSYFAWSAWAGSTLRPGENYSYTNNWPPEPLVGNTPTADTMVWSVISLIALLGGTGALFAAFGRWNWLGWHGRDRQELRFRDPQTVSLTPSQRATAWFFFTMTALFLIQTVVGSASQHYRADLGSFFGIPLDQWLPYNLMRTWHVQLSLLWVATSFLAAGHLPRPDDHSAAGSEGSGARWPTRCSARSPWSSSARLAGEAIGIHGGLGDAWSWLGMQGFEYLDLGKLWQVLLTVAWSSGSSFSGAACDAGWPLRAGSTCRGCSSSPRWPCRWSTPPV